MKQRNILSRPQMWLWISAATIAVSLIVIFTLKPQFGIDFTGGALIEIEAPEENSRAIRQLVESEFSLSTTTQPTQDDSIIIRLPNITEEQHQAILEQLRDQELATGEELRFETIGPTIGQELRSKSAIAISLVIAVLIGYLAYTFRETKKVIAPWKFGVAAAYALIHDLLIVTALFVILGRIWGATIDTLFVTAQLAILGYSVNDTIVLFHRFVKERRTKPSDPLLQTLNGSIWATLGRSFNTSFTTLIVLIALLVFGGSTIRWFVAALALGTITGTYSSLFVAPPLLLKLVKRK